MTGRDGRLHGGCPLADDVLWRSSTKISPPACLPKSSRLPLRCAMGVPPPRPPL